MIIKRILYLSCFSIVLTLSSCVSYDKEEYKILSKAVDEYVYPSIDSLALKILKEKNVNFSKAVDLAERRIAKSEHSFTISDTLYPADFSENKGIWDDLHNRLFFYEVKDRSDKPLVIDFSQLKFKSNMKRISQPSDDSNYIGHYKLHRVLFDKRYDRAIVQIETPQHKKPPYVILPFKKKDGKWIMESLY
ncbi:hypothetical protein [Chryseobacterium sp. JK1]|uniref:hypothetical protein n=1 Tax=Chryseobacterium sp. JK1 TaxID=874294 RepID=UPI003D68535F